MSKTLKIQNTYYDALFFATASMNEKKSFYLTPAEERLLRKLIHYGKNQINITWSSENISKHIYITPTAVDKLIQRLKAKGYINVSTIQIEHKVKQRTIFINWKKFEAINQLIEEYQNITDCPEEIAMEQESKIEEEPIQLEKEEKTIDLLRFFEPFVRNEDGQINDDKFDKLMNLIDVIKKGFGNTSNQISDKQLNTVHIILPNQTNILTNEEIIHLQELITENIQLVA